MSEEHPMKRSSRDASRCRKGVLGLALSIALAPAFVAPVCAAGDRNLPDESITDAIEDELMSDRVVPMTQLEIGTSDGIVTLTGTVDNLLAKTRAARIATTVKGVRSVVNRIDVEPDVQRSNEELENLVAAALIADAATEAYEIEAQAQDGVVTLAGAVESWQEEQLVLKVAKGVSGVEEIQNEIDINYEFERPDSEIRAEIAKTLRYDVLVDDGMIEVEVDDGRVTLTGKVGSAAERDEAYADAWVGGVESVDTSGLEVVWWADEDNLRQDKYVNKSADEIRQAVQAALKADPRVSSFAIDAEAAGGTVTLRGAVDSLKAKRAAANDARNTVGVWSVTNRIEVRPEKPLSDQEIAANIRDALTRDPFVEDRDVTLNVTDGIAHLSGIVDSFFEKAQADDVAARVEGVLSVDNNLLVNDDFFPVFYDPYVNEFYTYDFDYEYEPGYPWADDAEISEDVKDQMWWSPFVDADDIYVTIDDGVAILTGTVDTWAERRAATENAYDGGAIWVDNDLVVL